ncbi:MAG TPA: DUF6166 domain-containing protein, partial [Ktedonobacteraceae bacterium]|nr:DUF6166 domain-containing protein [Ktedonobacteraceae bacterium]
ERLTQHAVQSTYEFLEKIDTLPEADAIVAAPITFSNVNQWVQGTGDSLAVLVLCEESTQGIPTIAAPYIRPGLMQHPALVTNIAQLRQWNIRVLYEPEKAHALNMVPWEAVLEELRLMQQQYYQNPVPRADIFPEEIATADAAEKYQLSPGYLARLARTGTVRARRFGRDWIIDETALRAYLAQPRKPGPRTRVVKVYRGWREKDATGYENTHVTVNGNSLAPFNTVGPRPPRKIRFEWGYYGAGPSQLATAILADYFGESSVEGWANWETSRAIKYVADFKNEVIGHLPPDSWELTSEQIREWLEKRKEAGKGQEEDRDILGD